MTKKIFAVLMLVLLVSGLSFAADVCEWQAGSVVISAPVFISGKYAEPIVIEETVTGVQAGYIVNGEIQTASGGRVQLIEGSWLTSSKVRFTFNAISVAGTYKFKSYLLHPVTQATVNDALTVAATPLTFTLKSQVQASLTIKGGLQQFTTKDIVLTLETTDVSGLPIETIRELKVNGAFPSIPARYSQVSIGKYDITIDKNNLREGTFSFQVAVSDPQGRYEPNTVTLSNVNVIKPVIVVRVDSPATSTMNQNLLISVSVLDYQSQYINPETLELTVTYGASGVTKRWLYNAIQNDFTTQGTGRFQVDFVPVDNEARRYQWHAYATLTNYYSGATDPDPVTIIEGGEKPTCDSTDACDTGCPFDPDCQEQPFPWLLVIVVLAVAGVIGFIVLKRR